jgi:hypothetical protein
MNECHPSIRSILLPVHPLDTLGVQRVRLGEGASSPDSNVETPLTQSCLLKLRAALSRKGRGPRYRHRIFEKDHARPQGQGVMTIRRKVITL